MSLQTTVFLETTYETTQEARAARDAKAADLEAQGIVCHRSTLYRATDGRCIFLLEIEAPEPQERKSRSLRSNRSGSPRSRTRPTRQAKSH